MNRFITPRFVLIALTTISLLFFLALLRVPRVDGQLVGSDGTFYYFYLRSAVIDHDLNFRNEYQIYGIPLDRYPLTVTGMLPNKYSIGPALLWLPFFLVAHVIALTGQLLGFPIASDGNSYLYQAAICIGSIVYAASGIWLAYRSARRFSSTSALILAMILLWFGSNLFYYAVFEPSMAHMVSLWSCSLLCTIWLEQFRQPEPPKFGWAIALGVAAGLVLLVRMMDAVILILPIGSFLAGIWRAYRQRNWLAVRGWCGAAVLCGLTTIVVFSPQLVVWHILYGTWWLSPYINDHIPAFYWAAPQIWGVLFSGYHGLFSWHPIYLAGLIGLLLLLKSDRRLALGLLIVFVLNTYLISAWWAWWQGDSYGGRMFLNMSWIWMLGLAILLERIKQARMLPVAIGVGALLIAWNALGLIQYRLGFVPMNADLTWQQLTIGRFEVILRLLRRS